VGLCCRGVGGGWDRSSGAVTGSGGLHQNQVNKGEERCRSEGRGFTSARGRSRRHTMSTQEDRNHTTLEKKKKVRALEISPCDKSGDRSICSFYYPLLKKIPPRVAWKRGEGRSASGFSAGGKGGGLSLRSEPY